MGLWTPLHAATVLPSYVLMLGLAILARRWLADKSYETRMLPIKIIAVLLPLLEVGKQVCSVLVGYDRFSLPFHFCSIFLYILPIMAFYRGKYAERIRCAACACMAALLFGMLAAPALIYVEGDIRDFFTDYLAFHTVFFHALVIFALFFVITLDLHRSCGGWKETRFLTLFGLGFVSVAITATYSLDTNFSLFLSPPIQEIRDALDAIKQAIGQVPGQILYVAVLVVLHLLLLACANYLFLLLCLIKERLVRAFRSKRA